MQALGSWPFHGVLLELPQFEFRLGSASFRCSTRARKKRVDRVDVVLCLRRGDRLFGSSCVLRNRNGVYCRSEYISLGIGCFLSCSEIKPVLSGQRKSSIGICSPIGWALEEQADDDCQESSEQDGNLIMETEGDVIDPLSQDISGEGELRLDEIVDCKDAAGVVRDKRNVEEDRKARVDVRGIAQRLQPAKSVEDVEEVLKNEGRLPLQIFSSIIRSFGREKRLEPAMAVVEWLKKKHKENEEFDCPNLFIYNSLLGAVKQSGEFDKVQVIMNGIDEAGLSPNVVTYNTLMGIYLDEGRAAEALNLFEDIQNKGIYPSAASYSTALQAYRRMEDGNGALRLFVSMREKFMNGELQKYADEDWETEFRNFEDFTGRVCYQVMRRWLVKDGNLTTNVLKLLIELDKVGMPPTTTEYERLIWACTREEHCTVAKELYNRIRERRSGISLSVCNHIIWLMGKAKKWWAALEIYEDLLEEGPKPNNLSYELVTAHFNILLSSAKKRGIWRWGVSLLEKMEAKGLKPGSREWNAVLVACSRASEATAAVEIFKKMVEKGEKPTEVSYGALLSALEKGKLYDEAIRVWEHMLKVGIKPNLYSYTIMASVYVGLGKFHLVDYIIEEMISTGNAPTVVTFNAIISVCARNCLGAVAYDWFQRMKVMNIEPNEITYEMLIEALAKDGKPRLAYDMYLRVLNEGLSLSSKSYDAIIESSRTFGATIDATALGPRPPEQRKKSVPKKNMPEPSDVAEVPDCSEPFDTGEMYAQQAENQL